MSSYSKDQETIVLKVLSYKPHQYYEILSVEKTANDSDIKKSYRKLAVKLHPDKNPHPRSSEAFKYLNKAWGVLSDPSKKKIFDQTGSDPEARFASQSSASGMGGMGGMRGSPFASTSGFESGFEEDIFNLFFGGNRHASGGPTFSFGNNGFAFQSFGGGEHPFFASNTRARQQQQQRQRRQQQQTEEPAYITTIKQFLPIILFILVPLFSALFSESSVPDYSFNPTPAYNTERLTPTYKIPFYVAKDFTEKKKLTGRQLKNFDYKVENIYVQDKRSKCSKEQIRKNELMEDAQGWFSIDYEKLRKADAMPMPNCQALRQLNLI